jgi:hypothetical protein
MQPFIRGEPNLRPTSGLLCRLDERDLSRVSDTTWPFFGEELHQVTQGPGSSCSLPTVIARLSRSNLPTFKSRRSALVSPKALVPDRGQLGVAHRMLNVLVPKVRLQPSP